MVDYRVFGAGVLIQSYGCLDLKGRWELVDKTLELYKKTELEELKRGRRRGHRISLWPFRL